MTRPASRSRTLRFQSCLLGLGIFAAACSGEDDPAGFAGELEFRGEQPFLPGFDFDSGFLPAGSPVSVRATLTAGGGVTVVSRATTDGERLVPVAGSGSIAVQGGLALEISAKIDVTGAQYEGVVDSFEYTIEAAEQAFEPFALDTSAVVTSMLPPAQLGAVPIPGLPGATLVVEVTGGTISTTFAGTCADAADGFGQVAGALTMEGAVAIGASVEIDIPFVLTETFGPFPIDVPIPALTTALDLGTRSLATGEVAEAKGICDGAGTSGDGTGSPVATDGDTHAADTIDDAADTGAADTQASDSGASDTDASDTDASDTETSDTDANTTDGPSTSDPDYPNPSDAGCPPGWDPIALEGDPPNGVCSPLCDGGRCPNGATGNATGACAFNPLSSYTECADNSGCFGDETCVLGYCELVPDHCLLLCDDVGTCPDSMTCLSGTCLYLL